MVAIHKRHNPAAIRMRFTATIMLMRFLRKRHREAAEQKQGNQQND